MVNQEGESGVKPIVLCTCFDTMSAASLARVQRRARRSGANALPEVLNPIIRITTVKDSANAPFVVEGEIPPNWDYRRLFMDRDLFRRISRQSCLCKFDGAKVGSRCPNPKADSHACDA